MDEKIRNKWTLKKKRYIGWLCEHLMKTLKIPDKSYKYKLKKKRVAAARFYLMTFCAYLDYITMWFDVE